MNIYVGNISYDVEEHELRELFEEYGEVYKVNIIKDRETGRPKGFGFVEMEQEGGRQAIEELNEHNLRDRDLIVNVAREKQDRKGGGGRPRFNNRY